MKKRLVYITALILAGIINSAVYGQVPYFYAQSGTTMEKLQGRIWGWEFHDGRDLHRSDLLYDLYAETSSIYHEGKKLSASNPFYLSNTIDVQFDDSKVGKTQNGKYLIRKGNGALGSPTIFVDEILTLNDKELKTKYVTHGTVVTYKNLGYSMQYIINKMNTEKLPFEGTKQAKFIEQSGLPISNPTTSNTYSIDNSVVSAKLYKNVQLTEYENVVVNEGKFFRKVQLSNGNYIVVVTFGGIGVSWRTDMLYLVDKNGNVLSSLEGGVTFSGMTVKQYRIMDSGSVFVSQVRPSSSTALRFDLTSFSGYVETLVYGIVDGKFKNMSGSGTSTKTFTKALLSDPNKNVWQY